MIGMMYLVLTALLALNVSKEILNAFVIVEDGLNSTNNNFDGKNGVLYAKFEKAKADNPVKTKPFYDKAQIVRKNAADLCKMVDDIKSDLYLKVQGLPSKQVADTFKLKQLDSKDNYDIPTHYMLGADPEAPGADAHAIPLKNALIKYKKDLTALVPEKEKANLKLGLNTEDVYSTNDEKKISWEFNNFDHTTMAATMCILAGLKNDVKNAESDVVNALLKEITANDFSFDKVEPKIVAESNYIISGEEYKADIFMSAHSSTQNPQVLVGNVDSSQKPMKIIGTPIDVPVSDGMGKFVVKTGNEGLQEYSGIINVKDPHGVVKPYPFKASYTVAKPSFAISPTKMNVFYIGVENPVDISVAGAAPQNVVPSISGGGGVIVNKGQGHFIVTVKTQGECNVGVSIKDPKTNTAKSMGTPMKFRVKIVPNPTTSFAGQIGDGNVSVAEIKNAPGVIANLADFPFELKFPVVSWNMSVNVNGLQVDEPAVGPAVTAKQKLLLDKVKKNGRVIIEQVFIMKPEGKAHITGCILKVK